MSFCVYKILIHTAGANTPGAVSLFTACYFFHIYSTLYAVTVAFIWLREGAESGQPCLTILPFTNRSSQMLVIKSGDPEIAHWFSVVDLPLNKVPLVIISLTSWREEMGGQARSPHPASSGLPTPSHSHWFSHCSPLSIPRGTWKTWKRDPAVPKLKGIEWLCTVKIGCMENLSMFYLRKGKYCQRELVIFMAMHLPFSCVTSCSP